MEEFLNTIVTWLRCLNTRMSPDRSFYYKPLLILATLDILDSNPDHDNYLPYEELRRSFTRRVEELGSVPREAQFSQPYFYLRKDTEPKQVWCLETSSEPERMLDAIRGDNPARVRAAAPSAYIDPLFWPVFKNQHGRDRIRQAIYEIYQEKNQ